MKNNRHTAAIILISTLYSGFISVACTVQRTGATHHHPRIPCFIHRREIVFIRQKNRRIRMRDLSLPCFSVRRRSAPGVGGLLEGVGVQIGRDAGVVQRLVVDHHIRPAGFGINARNCHKRILVIFRRQAARLP